MWFGFLEETRTISLLISQGLTGFRNVTMTIEPPYVENGRHATLSCLYELEGDPLYSVKWYRGTFEFYRYSPSENPPKKIFTYPGFHVDLSYSNATAVFLRNVGFSLGGNVSCEVTTDAPSFKTRHAKAYLNVVSRPKERPELHVNKDKYNVGDILLANCTSFPSKPPAMLSFHINNSPIQ
ncbi:hypothetical protein RUM44_008822 [Polyplax serrata]|uniref:Ig-like domain-containing protein n=1 Tax=Polyplax serrata TaxID=468196 RepID=A0ABR1B9B2_POLSC